MSTKTPSAEKRSDQRDWTARETRDALAREQCHDADYLGRDHEGVYHYWSIYHQTVVVIDVDERDLATVHIPGETGDSGIAQLGDWVRYVDEERGWTDVYFADSLGDLLTEALE